MLFRRLTISAAATALCASIPLLVSPGLASAHTLLVNPEPLQNNDDAKEPACGCTFGGGLVECPSDYQVTDYEPGETITITWNETIDHDGDFRVAFVAKPPDQVTDAEFEASAIKFTQIDDRGVGLKSGTLTLPMTPCAECTIQVRQFMMGTADPYYYTCAAISIGASAGEGGAPATGGSSAQGAGTGEGATGAGSGGDEGNGKAGGEAVWAGPEQSDGCSLSTGPSALGWSALALALGLARAARRRR